MMRLLLITCLTSLTIPSQAQVSNSNIDRNDLKLLIKILSADSLEGRGTGTAGQRKAEKFIADRFQRLGLQPYRQNGYLERFKLTQTYWGQVYLKTPNATLRNFENMVFQGTHVQNEETEKEVVFGGYGTEAELNQIEVNGRFVLVFVKNLRSHDEINSRLKHRNAAGIILANPAIESQFESIRSTLKDHALQKRLALQDKDSTRFKFLGADTINFLNTITIPNSVVKAILGRSMKELIRLQETGRIREVPLAKVSVKFEFIREELETSNVVGVIPGRSKQSIIISAHYDHLGKSEKEYFPGADDNASGTAALLELAEEFSKSTDLEYNLIFLATSGEEAGLLGSLYHVSQPDFDPTTIVCNLNLDMISRKDEQHQNEKYLYCIGTDQSAAIDRLIRKADRLFDPCAFDYSLNNSKDPAGLFTRSDQYSFYKKGIIAIHFFSGLHGDYHKPTDTVDKINFTNLENRVKQISLVVELLQKEGLKN